MSRKIITGAIIALAGGIAAYIYRHNRNKINSAAANAYEATKDAMEYTVNEAENAFS